MADLNNTIQAIEHCANGGYCIRCKLRDDRRCDAITSCKTLLTDALELLKDQQPKKPHYSVLRYLINGQVMMIDHPECPKCFENGFRLYEAEIEKGQKFCKRCGQAIDWSKDGEQE